MASRQHFYNESLGTDSTTSTTPQLKAEIAWTPDANTDYWVLASASFNNSSATDNHEGLVDLYDVTPAVTLSTQSQQSKELTTPIDWYPFSAIAKLSYGASPASQSLRIIFYSSNSGDTTKIRDARLCIIKADAADQYAETLAQTTTTSSTPSTRTTLTFTPGSSGDYLVIGSAELTGDVNGYGICGRLTHSTTSTDYAARNIYCKDDFDNLAFLVALKLTLSGSNTFLLKHNSVTNGQLTYIQNARILALRLDTFNNVYSAQTTASSGSITNQTSYQDAQALTATPVASPHLLIGSLAWNGSSTTISGYAEFNNGSQVQEWDRESAVANAYVHTGFFQIAQLAASSTTWKWRVKTEGNETLTYYDRAIHVIELGPYTKTASFDGAVLGAIAATAGADVAVLTSRSIVASADVAAQLVRSLTASIDLYVTAGASVGTVQASFDAAVLNAITATLAAEGAVQTALSITASADGAAQASRSLVASLDLAASLLRTATTLHDVAVQATPSATVGADVAAQTTSTQSASLAVAAQVLATVQAQLDAAVLQTISASVGASGAVQTAFVAAASLDAAVQALRSAAASLDTAVSAGQTASLGADANIVVLSAASVTASLDAAIQAVAVAGTSLGAAVQASISSSASADAALAVVVTSAISATLAVSLGLTAVLSADAAIAAPRLASASFDTPVQSAFLVAIGCDCRVLDNSIPIVTLTALLGSRQAASGLAGQRLATSALLALRRLSDGLLGTRAAEDDISGQVSGPDDLEGSK